MRRILLITTSYPTGLPGSEAAGGFVADFATELARHVEVVVLAPAARAHSSKSGSLRVETFPVPRTPLSLLKPLDPRDWPAIVSTLRKGSGAVRRLTKEGPFDHILALWALPSGYWARAAASFQGIPYSIWALGSDIWTLSRVPGVRQVLKRVLKGASRLFADGYGLCREVQALSGRDCLFMSSARRLDPPSSPPARTTPPFRLAFLGRWHPNKGVDLLLEALDLLPGATWERIEQVRIHGGGPLEPLVRKQVDDLRAQGRPVDLGGYLDKGAATRLLQWADFVLIPSRIESIPVIFSDAMQVGRPVISTPAGDLPELVARYGCGEMAENCSAATFAQAVERALAKRPQEFGPGIQTAARAFRIDNSVQQFLSLGSLKE